MTGSFFLFGLLVTGMTLVAVVLVGISEAGDTDHARGEDLTDLEKRVIGNKRVEDDA